MNSRTRAGQLGHGDAEERLNPQAIFSLLGRNVRYVTCGAEYSMCVAKTATGCDEVYAWGWADFGRYAYTVARIKMSEKTESKLNVFALFYRLGLGACSDVFIPTPIPSFSGMKVAAIACGDTHTLVCIEGSGDLYTFGRNQVGKQAKKNILKIGR